MKSIKGFTLIELLIVVLIIGVIAGIAVPQYRKMVLKTKYATLKNTVKYMAEREEEFYRGSGNIGNLYDLNIEIGTIQSESMLKINDDITCLFQGITDSYQLKAICVIGKLRYQQTVRTRQHRKIVRQCVAYTTDTKDIYNRICQEETGKKEPHSNCVSYCNYYY